MNIKHKIFILLLATAFFAPFGKAKAARLWTTGFEMNSVTDGVEFDQYNVSSGPANSISSAQAHGGTYSNLFNIASAGVSLNVNQFSSGTGVIFARENVYLSAYPSSVCTVFEFLDLGTYVLGGAFINSSGQVGIFYKTAGGVGTYRAVLSSALSTGAWHRIELKIDDTGTNTQVITLVVDGTQIDSYTNNRTVTASTLAYAVWGAFLEEAPGTISNMYIDDIAVNDNSGSYQNSYPGEGKVILLAPNATGDANAWGAYFSGTLHAGSSTDWGLVDDIPPDESELIVPAGLNSEDLFNVTDSGIGAKDIVNVVNVGVRFVAGDLNPQSSFKVEIEKAASGTKYQSSAITPTDHDNWHTNSESPPLTYPITLYQDPDSSAWTQSKLDSMQIGVKCSATNTSNPGVDTLWAMVDYTPNYSPVIIRKSAGGPTIFRRNVIFK